jgi:hypothetical protein
MRRNVPSPSLLNQHHPHSHSYLHRKTKRKRGKEIFLREIENLNYNFLGPFAIYAVSYDVRLKDAEKFFIDL